MKHLISFLTLIALLIPNTLLAGGDVISPPAPTTNTLENQSRYSVSMTIDGRALKNLSTSTATLNTPHTFFYAISPSAYWEPGQTNEENAIDFADAIQTNVTYIELWKGAIFGPDATFVQAWDTEGKDSGSLTAVLPESGGYFFLVNTPNTIARHPIPVCSATITQNCTRVETLLSGTMEEQRKSFMAVPSNADRFHSNWGLINQNTLAIGAVRFTVTFPLVRQSSNIIFFPGVTGSRLYEQVKGKEKKYWELNLLTSQADARSLYLAQNGKSIRPIYTKLDAAIAHADIPLIGFDIYRSFFNQLASFKASRQINDFVIFPYDWRLSPVDIAENGTEYESGIRDIEKTITALASSSPTGKVTIVGHSNGGLVAKALMIRLQRNRKVNLIDKVLLIDVPQVGTPDTLLSLLHGDFGALTGLGGIFLSQSNARGLMENMPAAMDLLPSPAYFAKVADPVIDMTGASMLRLASGASSQYIASQKDLFTFLTANAAHPKPVANDIASPNTISPKALSIAAAHHLDLDAWTPPFAVRLVQIAGWGLETTKTISYNETRDFQCTLPVTCGMKTTVHHGLNTVIDGDGTVLMPSETAISRAETYYVDLFRSNRDLGESHAHADVTETKAFQDLFTLLLGDSLPPILPLYVSASIPKADAGQSGMRIHLNGLAVIHAIDSIGHTTGPVANASGEVIAISQSIPNSNYRQVGNDTYLSLVGSGPVKVSIQAMATDTISIDISTSTAGGRSQAVSYQNLLATPSTAAYLTINPTALVIPPMFVDSDADGIPDKTLEPITATDQLPENDSALAYLNVIIKTVPKISVASTVDQTIRQLTNAKSILLGTTSWNMLDPDNDVAQYVASRAKHTATSTFFDYKIQKIQHRLAGTIGFASGMPPYARTQVMIVIQMMGRLFALKR